MSLITFLSLMIQLGNGYLLGCSLGEFKNLWSISRCLKSFGLRTLSGSSFSNCSFSFLRTDESLAWYTCSKKSSQESEFLGIKGIDSDSIFCERMKEAGTVFFNPIRCLLVNSLLIPSIAFFCSYIHMYIIHV